MYADAARAYDLIHDAVGRDPDTETDLVTGELRRRRPQARSLLDVACGTGANLRRFAESFEVAGLDSSADMLAVAAGRCPGVSLVRADMRDFDLGRSFDAIVCLFSGIGYLTEPADLRQAVATMAAHLTAAGILMIEGWIEPAYWLRPTANAECGRWADVAVTRVTRSRRDGMRTDLFMRYTVATLDDITTIDEHHVMRLSDPAEFESAYAAAGLTFERLPHVLNEGRAVYVGTTSGRG